LPGVPLARPGAEEKSSIRAAAAASPARGKSRERWVSRRSGGGAGAAAGVVEEAIMSWVSVEEKALAYVI
jgi:hypothetical protein